MRPLPANIWSNRATVIWPQPSGRKKNVFLYNAVSDEHKIWGIEKCFYTMMPRLQCAPNLWGWNFNQKGSIKQQTVHISREHDEEITHGNFKADSLYWWQEGL